MNVTSSSTCYTRFGLVDDEPHTVYVCMYRHYGNLPCPRPSPAGISTAIPAASNAPHFQCPVFITDRNRPSLVVLAIDDYERLAGRGTSLLEVLMPDDYQEVDFEPPKAHISAQPAELD